MKAQLYTEKPLDTESKYCDLGFRIDYLFGADGPDTQASGDQGWDFGWNTSRDYGSAIPQLYVEVGTENFAMLTGYFIGLQGFEAAQSIENFFYSHNYAFGYGVPGTHAVGGPTSWARRCSSVASHGHRATTSR